MRLSEAQKWHLSSWIIPSIIAVVLAGVTVGLAVPMPVLIAIILAVWLLLNALVWTFTPPKSHHTGKIVTSVLLTVAMIASVSWAWAFDRPILRPQVGGLITQNFNENAFALDVETLIRNSGHQGGYADRWQLKLIVDGTEMIGRETFGQLLPAKAVKEPEIADQEFPPDKPVRGWLFFGFPGTSHDALQAYFFCGSSLTDKVSLELSVWDSKNKREWTQRMQLRDLYNQTCKSVEESSPKQP